MSDKQSVQCPNEKTADVGKRILARDRTAHLKEGCSLIQAAGNTNRKRGEVIMYIEQNFLMLESCKSLLYAFFTFILDTEG